MASCDTGYEDELFEQTVSPSFHCVICTNVIKDPVACRHNEHLFCRACITEHLKNYQTCPSCMDPLTVDTLSQASRGVRNLLAELKIRCKFFDRGCGKFIELGTLESHLRECGFAPAVCSNEGCQLEVNKQDLLHHEMAVCELRRVKCHSCNDIRQEMDIVKVTLAAVNERIDNNERKLSEKLEKNHENMKAAVENVVAKVELIREQLYIQKANNCHVQEDIVEMKKSLNEITKQLERITQQTSHELQTEEEQMKKGIAEAVEVDGEPKVVIAGGKNLNSAEMFSLSNGTWTLLQPMRERRSGASSVVYNNKFIVIGGWAMSMEKLSLNAVHIDQSITWEKMAPGQLFKKLTGQSCIVYNGRLIVIGGYGVRRNDYLDTISEVTLVPPYTSRLLTTMPQKRCYHGVAMFGDKVVIVGGREGGWYSLALRNVVMYDISNNKCEELAPLPYPVCEMATVKWGDENFIIMGGVASNNDSLNTVLIYNVKTQKSYMLPDMKYKRGGCVAAIVRDSVVVMGGVDERRNCLKSVECFTFDRYTWEELPEMHEARCSATAARIHREGTTRNACTKTRKDWTKEMIVNAM